MEKINMAFPTMRTKTLAPKVDLIGEAMRELLEIPRPKGEELDLRLRKTLLFLSNASELLGTFRRAEIPNSDPQPSSSDDESGGGAV